MTDKYWEETIYFKIGILGVAESAMASFTVPVHAGITPRELRSILENNVEDTARQAADEFGPIFIKALRDSIERHVNDPDSEW